MKKITTLLFAALFAVTSLSAQHIISVSPDGVNDVKVIKDAIEQARSFNDEVVVIKPGGGDYYLARMKNGRFEISKTANFASATLLHTVPNIPAFECTLVPVENETFGRYVRYASPQDGFGNIAEVEFYGKRVYTGVDHLNGKEEDFQFINNRDSREIIVRLNNAPNNETPVMLYNLAGVMLKSEEMKGNETTISYSGFLPDCYIVRVRDHRKKVILN